MTENSKELFKTAKLKVTKHNSQNYEWKCPHCNSETVSEATKWCYTHESPYLEDEPIFCDEPGSCVLVELKDAYMCNVCNYMFDEEKMFDWGHYIFFSHCPIGKKLDPEVKYELIEEYRNKLYELIQHYDSSRIDNCLSQGYYLEAIATTHIQISILLKFLLVNKLTVMQKTMGNPQSNPTKLIKKQKDSNLYLTCYSAELIDFEMFSRLKKMNQMRNAFAHSFEERESYKADRVTEIVNKSKEIIIDLQTKCEGIFNRELSKEINKKYRD